MRGNPQRRPANRHRRHEHRDGKAERAAAERDRRAEKRLRRHRERRRRAAHERGDMFGGDKLDDSDYYELSEEEAEPVRPAEGDAADALREDEDPFGLMGWY